MTSKDGPRAARDKLALKYEGFVFHKAKLGYILSFNLI